MKATENFRRWRAERLSPNEEARWRYYAQRDMVALGVWAMAAAGAVWWWALLGMDSKVGTAVSITLLIPLVPLSLGLLGSMAHLLKLEKKDEEAADQEPTVMETESIIDEP